MKVATFFRAPAAVTVALSLVLSTGAAFASHSWGPYHWARTANPFALNLGDNVSSAWDAYLAGASADWSASDVLDTAVVAGLSNRNCRPTAGRAEVCSAKYGYNGWLGLAQIWINAESHIAQGVVKLNDSYFNTATYNKPAWRRFVMCQEVGHVFGLDHQDENFSNANLGTCMDYTNDPDGTLYGQLSNEHPNLHDYEQLALIYEHLDSSTTLSADAPSSGRGGNGNAAEWGRSLRSDAHGRPSLFVNDLGGGERVFTFVYWAD